MAQCRELDQRRACNRRGGGLAQCRVIAQRGLQFGRGLVTTDRCAVLLADEQRGRYLQILQFMDDGLVEHHVRGQRLAPGDLLLARALVHARLHARPRFVRRLPLAVVVHVQLVAADAVIADVHFTGIPRVHAAPGHAQRLPVFQPDRIDQRQAAQLLRIHQRIADGQHAAHRMTDHMHRHVTQLQLLQQRVGIVGKLPEGILVALGLARFAEAHLVRRDHPVASSHQRLDRLFPGRCAEVLAMQQHHHADRLLLRRDIQIGHFQRLVLRFQHKGLHRIAVIEPFQPRPVGWRSENGQRNAGKQGSSDHTHGTFRSRGCPSLTAKR
ncbi:hypothetical protein D3C73_935550 [compost metagenome]